MSLIHWPRLQNWNRLCKECNDLGYALLEVPADGNCLAWSLRCCLKGAEQGSIYDGPRAERQQRQIRRQLSSLWKKYQNDQIWQALFTFCVAEEYSQPMESTPPKNSTNHPIDLLTPPKVDLPLNAKRLQKIGEAKPVPFAAREETASPTLRPRARNKRPAALESSEPDLEEIYRQTKKMKQKRILADNDDDPAEDSENLDSMKDADLDSAKRTILQKKSHKRTCKKRKPTETEQQRARLDDWLASLGCTYYRFLETHRNQTCIKASVCADGGYKALKLKLSSGQASKCERCVQLLSQYDVTLEKVKEVIIAKDKEPEIEAEENPGPSHNAVLENDDQEETCPLDECKAFMKTQEPYIELLHTFPFKFRCRVCRSKTQIDGKVNCLGKPVLKWWKHFVDQHCKSKSHIAALVQFDLSQKNVDEDLSTLCPGYAVSTETGFGSLRKYVSEFSLFMSHNHMQSSLVKHKYFKNEEGIWHVRHQKCTGKLSRWKRKSILRNACCELCESLAEPKGIQKQLIRFLTKYHAAILLQNRLFVSEKELEQTMNDISQSAFGKHHALLWQRLQNFKLPELQAFVRASYVHLSTHEATSVTKAFVASVVDPCMKISLNSVDFTMNNLSAQFVQALQTKKLNAAWATFGVCGLEEEEL